MRRQEVRISAVTVSVNGMNAELPEMARIQETSVEMQLEVEKVAQEERDPKTAKKVHGCDDGCED